MNARLRAIGERRAALRTEIGAQRAALGQVLRSLGKDFAWAGIGLMAGGVLARHRWVKRILMLGSLAALAAKQMSARGWRMSDLIRTE